MNGTKLYTDISQLSLVAGCSLTDIVTALPNNSIAMLYTNNSDRLVNDVPHPYGCLHIFKNTANRVTCKFWSSQDSTSYERVYNAEFVSDWKQVISNADLEVNTAKIGNCAAKTVTTYYVKFDTPFSSAPIVVATLNLHTENANNSDITITVSNVTNAGFNIRYINNTDNQISNGTVNWIAIRK